MNEDGAATKEMSLWSWPQSSLGGALYAMFAGEVLQATQNSDRL
jgi:hypothetical protein